MWELIHMKGPVTHKFEMNADWQLSKKTNAACIVLTKV